MRHSDQVNTSVVLNRISDDVATITAVQLAIQGQIISQRIGSRSVWDHGTECASLGVFCVDLWAIVNISHLALDAMAADKRTC
jgi:hypothetical protein